MSYERYHHKPLSAGAYFDDQNDRYRLCCCHVRSWATIIGILKLTVCVLLLVGIRLLIVIALGDIGVILVTVSVLIVTGARGRGALLLLLGVDIGLITSIVFIILMLFGVKEEKRFLLIPHIVLQVITIICLLIGAALMLISTIVLGTTTSNRDEQEVGTFRPVHGTTTSNRDQREIAVGIGIGISVAFLIGALIEAFFLYPIIRCYRYLADKALAKEPATHVPMAVTYSTVEQAI